MRPGKKHSEEEAQDQVKADSLGLDDLVTINGITGYVDFIGGDIIVLCDEKDERRYILPPHSDNGSLYAKAFHQRQPLPV